MSFQARLPPVVNDLFRRMGIDSAECARADGRFTLNVGDCGAVDLVPTSGHRIILDAVIGPADQDAHSRKKQIEKVLKFAASRMIDHPETATLSEGGDVFHLQSYLDAGMSPVDTEDAMSDFLNALTAWRVVLEMSKDGASASMPSMRMAGLP